MCCSFALEPKHQWFICFCWASERQGGQIKVGCHCRDAPRQRPCFCQACPWDPGDRIPVSFAWWQDRGESIRQRCHQSPAVAADTCRIFIYCEKPLRAFKAGKSRVCAERNLLWGKLALYCFSLCSQYLGILIVLSYKHEVIRSPEGFVSRACFHLVRLCKLRALLGSGSAERQEAQSLLRHRQDLGPEG